jgi:plastocyanin
MKRRAQELTLAFLISMCPALPAAVPAADGWGSLTGQIIYDGIAPERKTFAGAGQFCGNLKLNDERLLVNRDNGGLANVGVWLSVAPNDNVKPAIHPNLRKLADQKIKIDNKQCRFEPHMAVVWTEQTVEFANSDPTGHNMNLKPLNKANIGFNELIPEKKSRDYRFNAEETLPVRVECNIHMFMNGWIIVKQTPYATVTDVDGKFVIEKIPAGKWKFRFWQEEFGYIQDVKLGDTAKKWKRGEVEIQIKDGEVFDLGIIKAQPKEK